MSACRVRPAALLGAALLIAGLAATGCTLGEAATFRGRANDACSKVTRSVENYRGPVTAAQALRYAIDRYSNMERLVSEITEDISRPGGATGHELDTGWFDPARASLRQGRTDLESLRRLARADDAAANSTAARAMSAAESAALLTAITAGTNGVDVALLRREGLDQCAVTFTTPTAVPTPAPSATGTAGSGR